MNAIEKINFDESLYSGLWTRSELIKTVDGILSSDDLSVRLIPFSSARDPGDEFPSSPTAGRSVEIVRSSSEVALFRLSYVQRTSKNSQREQGRFYVYRHPVNPSVYIALTLESGEFVKTQFIPMLRALYPTVNMTFISHKKLREILDAFKTDTGFSDITVTRTSHRSRLTGESGEKVVPLVSWPDTNMDRVFQWVHENNGWLNNLEFQSRRASGAKVKMAFTRHGIVRTSGFLPIAIKAFVDPVAKVISNNLAMFSGRSRCDNAELTVKPLTIQFGSDQFENVAENANFIKAMRRLKTASISVIHGNPYLHLSVIDYLDGSTFDLWVLKSNELVIAPQLRGSYGAIKRLINHVFDTYAEGDIKEYSESV